ncbi:amidase family protein [Tieghemostelium lacteum]|uniref:Amidase family protein n=1 Tax=Tieghemostelium lacteum TaxID=361077 RepID=A0A151Z3F3_TIELA|nr:amidase family protein [Tieghemostelium lacteum]|eukprot:KYQ88447.1 amidase family protein [Tieghemostelium lacteum]
MTTHTTTNTEKEVEVQTKQSVYDLTPLISPKVHGYMLRSTVFLCEVSPFKNIFLPSLYKKNNYNRVTDAKINLPATTLPLINQLVINNSQFKIKTLSIEEFFQNSPALISLYDSHESCENSISEYYKSYQQGKTTPLEVSKSFLECKDQSDRQSPPLAAFISNNREEITQQGQESLDRWQTGRPLSILDGVPVSIKDELDQIGYYTTCGTTFLQKCHGKKDKDSYVAAKLKQAGAILVGKNNMHEIGISTMGYNIHYGFTRNPYNLGHYTGGSSSGSAASVSSGLNPLSIGCDGGGSIRVPASLCGVVGLKPTFGRVSHTGVFELCFSVGHVGPIASNVLDCAIGYSLIAGVDPMDYQTMSQPAPTVPDFSSIQMGNQPLQGLRVGFFTEWNDDCHPEIRDQVYDAVRLMQEQGAIIVPIEIPELLKIRMAQGLIILSEMRNAMNPYLQTHKNEFHLDSRISLSVVDCVTSADYIQCNKIRTMAIESLKEIFSKQCDIIITPTTGITSPDIEDKALSWGVSNLTLVGKLMNYVFLGNISGVPGISIPKALDSKGLPIGIQLMSSWWQEDLLLHTGFILEKLFKFNQKPKGFYLNPLQESQLKSNVQII